MYALHASCSQLEAKNSNPWRAYVHMLQGTYDAAARSVGSSIAVIDRMMAETQSSKSIGFSICRPPGRVQNCTAFSNCI